MDHLICSVETTEFHFVHRISRIVDLLYIDSRHRILFDSFHTHLSGDSVVTPLAEFFDAIPHVNHARRFYLDAAHEHTRADTSDMLSIGQMA